MTVFYSAAEGSFKVRLPFVERAVHPPPAFGLTVVRVVSKTCKMCVLNIQACSKCIPLPLNIG